MHCVRKHEIVRNCEKLWGLRENMYEAEWMNLCESMHIDLCRKFSFSKCYSLLLVQWKFIAPYLPLD